MAGHESFWETEYRGKQRENRAERASSFLLFPPKPFRALSAHFSAQCPRSSSFSGSARATTNAAAEDAERRRIEQPQRGTAEGAEPRGEGFFFGGAERAARRARPPKNIFVVLRDPLHPPRFRVAVHAFSASLCVLCGSALGSLLLPRQPQHSQRFPCQFALVSRVSSLHFSPQQIRAL
jgi:hypothetical protein